MYKSENAFKQSVIRRLRDNGAFVTNIESHDTSVGIPDTYVCGAGDNYWIEFKNDSDQYIVEKKFKIPYRPGQLAWHSSYHHCAAKYVVTLMSVADGVLLLRGSGRLAQLMSSSFNEVDESYKHLYKITDKDWCVLNVNKLLRIMSNRCGIPESVRREDMMIKDPAFDEYRTFTNRDMVINWMEKYFPFEDYDPEALWNDSATIDNAFNRDIFDSKEYEMFCNCKLGL